MTMKIEHSIAALDEALFLLTSDACGYPAHYIEHPAYQRVVKYVRTQRDLAKQALDLENAIAEEKSND